MAQTDSSGSKSPKGKETRGNDIFGNQKGTKSVRLVKLNR